MVTRRRVVTSAIGALVVCNSWANAQPSRAPGEAPQRERTAALVRLAQPIDLETSEARLEDVLRFMEERADLSFEIMWQDDHSLDGLDPDASITIRLSAMPFDAALERILRQADRSLEGSTWQVDPESGAIQIGPRSQLNTYVRTEIYDLRDLLYVLPDFESAPQIDIDAALNQGGSGGGPGGSIFEDDDGEETDQPLPRDVARQIMEVILDFVESEQWIDNGGDGAQMRLLDQSLIVKAPGYIHRQLAD